MILNTGIEVLISAFFSASLAQIFKVLFFFTSNKKFNFKILTTTGGMPSSHSAGVIALTTSVGIITGYNSILFAISLGYAIVVMYDASGVRRAAGKTAATLNRLIREYQEHNNTTKPYEVLKELLGHSQTEVFWGAALGVVFAYFVHSSLILLFV